MTDNWKLQTRGIADNVELCTMDMPCNGRWKAIGNYRQWEMTDNGIDQINDDVRQWEMTHQWQTTETYIEWEWQTIEDERQLKLMTQSGK